MVRYVLYGGKGGVGKTTLAAATGIGLAREGHRTLAASTDPAHSLSDALGSRSGRPPAGPREPLGRRDRPGGGPGDRPGGPRRARRRAPRGPARPGEVEALFAAGVGPGSDELATVERLVEYADDDRFPRVVFDTAPTGHTLRLLELPDVLRAAMAVGETERPVERLRGFGIPVETLVVNRGLGDVDEDCDRCRRQRDSQQAHLAERRRRFPDLAVQVVPVVGPEVEGVASLERVAAAIYV